MEASMSTIRQNGLKTILPRGGADDIWKAIHEGFAHDDERKWRYLAMLSLREAAGWPLEYIGLLFSHPKGHVTRCLRQIKRELRDEFRPEPLPPHAQTDYLVDEDGFGLGAD